ncbi:pilus assembly protein N-terminal domain-containing protein [Guyparkeria hydrothermalis]|uniref:type II and III secretion system protein family protein n=1 Tax=Guyparkeria hydrothermalis TaxID=923 RepID=UPI00201FFB66|nr:pilus assembly protein N-terminal domain-containing protein [Guyparkeria hydrothermalis]MCL7743705.1 pilus assembly protein N-terminal domain-containing protein [Guyparkeria hydrothermalis]
MELSVGQQKTLSVDEPIDFLAVGDPDTVDAKVVGDTSVLLTPLRTGSTKIIVRLREGDEQVYPVRVKKAQVSGQVDSLEAQSMLTDGEGSAVDRSSTSFGMQVQTDVRIVEVNKTELKSVGSFVARATSNTTIASSPPGTGAGLGDIVSNTLNQLSSLILPDRQGYNLALGSAGRGWLAAINALESSGVAYTLANPSLVALSGQEAQFAAGGEVPIPVQQGVGDSISIEYREYGIRLRLTPTVLDDDRIVLKVAPEVSELDFSIGVRSGGVEVPGLRVRRTDTTVILGDGESFVISGLVSQSMMENADKYPGLGDIPILGAFFAGGRFSREDSELIMVVTPHLVRPLAAGATLPEMPGESLRDRDGSFLRLLGQDRYFGSVGDDETNTGFSD